MDIQDELCPNNGGKFLTGDMVEYSPLWQEWDSPGWVVITDEDEEGYFEIVNSSDDIVETNRDEVSFTARY
jgi:hypothetical protein